MDSNEENEYRNRLNGCAQTLADRMSILEARDRLMRLKRQRQTNLATAVAVVGTCPDMCPEFERYFREETNQVTLFEMNPITGRPDEHRMVKEYRRSGADQEEPLAHELRPTPVLNKTMNYLCTNIIDSLDVNNSCGEWFDFVWSRTRSIRKDITQQHLCDLEAVSLTEKCARFHIHCSATLCEQNIKDFDPKINEENLSNCLQSLKDLYYDLSLRDIYCPNESEFRCYDILLHLNDTAILKDVQNYRKQIRHSKDVELAIKAFFAFQSNNYIQFFKLVEQSSYLMSCILHRFFNQIRCKAFKILRKCYTFNSTSTQEYPSESLANNLGFEDTIELKSFCDQIGLESDHTFVYLIRGPNQTNAIKAQRSLRLVENKRAVSVGEIINGSTLPPNPYKVEAVHNSFDLEGRLKSDAIEAIDQKVKSRGEVRSEAINIPFVRPIKSNEEIDNNTTNQVISKPINTTNVGYREQPTIASPLLSSVQSNNYAFNKFVETQPPIESQSYNLADFSQTLSQEILEEVIDDLVVKICSQQMNTILKLIFQQIVCEIFSDLLLNTCDEVIKEISFDIIQKETQSKRIQQKVINELSNELFDSFIISEIISISNEVIVKTHEECVEKENRLISRLLFNDMIDDILKEMTHSVLSNERRVRESIVRLLRDKRTRSLEIKYFNKWKNWFSRRKRLFYLTQSFPAAPKWVSSPKPHKSLEHSYSNHIFDESFSESIELHSKANNLLNEWINTIINEMTEQFFCSSVSKNSNIFNYLKEKRQKWIQRQYFLKWKSFCANKRLNNRRKSFPAAPNLAANTVRCKTKYKFFDTCPQFDISSKKLRLEANQTSNSSQNTESNSKSTIKTLFDNELSESKNLTQRLIKEINSGPTPSPSTIAQTLKSPLNANEEIDTEDDENEIEVIEISETETQKINRLKRLLSEEKDFFSLQNFVKYLSNTK